ncbi:hypothetical protein O181_059576 [Austropuccinia psidii MF-1]|uniref:Uncharacterized protein n=1 Tax=Austropuccinia psidii MF-1 TaxID=1389203 RepID=A0A9Q3EJ83_9BASI|nr:hypothetical protein [Austropuccinia psidii MF-1]
MEPSPTDFDENLVGHGPEQASNQLSAYESHPAFGGPVRHLPSIDAQLSSHGTVGLSYPSLLDAPQAINHHEDLHHTLPWNNLLTPNEISFHQPPQSCDPTHPNHPQSAGHYVDPYGYFHNDYLPTSNSNLDFGNNHQFYQPSYFDGDQLGAYNGHLHQTHQVAQSSLPEHTSELLESILNNLQSSPQIQIPSNLNLELEPTFGASKSNPACEKGKASELDKITESGSDNTANKEEKGSSSLPRFQMEVKSSKDLLLPLNTNTALEAINQLIVANHVNDAERLGYGEGIQDSSQTNELNFSRKCTQDFQGGKSTLDTQSHLSGDSEDHELSLRSPLRPSSPSVIESQAKEPAMEGSSHPKLWEKEQPFKISKLDLPGARELEARKRETSVYNFSFFPSDEEVVWIASLPLKNDRIGERSLWTTKLSGSLDQLHFWLHLIENDEVGDQPFGRYPQFHDFACRLWDLHSRILERLGDTETAPQGLVKGERQDLLKWVFMEFVLSHHLTSDKTEGMRAMHGRLDWNCFMDALLAPPLTQKQKVWGVFYGIKEPNPEYVNVVYEKQFLATKAAIHILASYFKSQNITKWHQIFPQDEKFIRDFLKDIRRFPTTRFQKISEKGQMKPSNVFPWMKEVKELVISPKIKFTEKNCRTYAPKRFAELVSLLDPKDTRKRKLIQSDDIFHKRNRPVQKEDHREYYFSKASQADKGQ